MTGFLTRVDLAVGVNYPMEQDTLAVSIYTTLNGVPKTSLGSISFADINPNPTVMDWYSWDFSNLSVSLNAGQTYALVLNSFETSPFYGISAEGTVADSYGGGTSLIQVGDNSWEPYGRAQDLAFQTWMRPIPEPCTLALLVSGMALLIRRRK